MADRRELITRCVAWGGLDINLDSTYIYSMTETLADIRARHEHELAAAVEHALVAAGWSVPTAAAALETSTNAVYRIVKRNPQLQRGLNRFTPGRGRPRKTAQID